MTVQDSVVSKKAIINLDSNTISVIGFAGAGAFLLLMAGFAFGFVLASGATVFAILATVRAAGGTNVKLFWACVVLGVIAGISAVSLGSDIHDSLGGLSDLGNYYG